MSVKKRKPAKPKKKGKKRGPKKIRINWKKIDKLCQIQCTQEEIASVMGCDLDTIGNRCLEKHKIKFSEYFKQKRIGGRSSLRRTQWLMAQRNPALAIFLGKNYLGQADKSEIDLNDKQNMSEKDINARIFILLRKKGAAKPAGAKGKAAGAKQNQAVLP